MTICAEIQLTKVWRHIRFFSRYDKLLYTRRLATLKQNTKSKITEKKTINTIIINYTSWLGLQDSKKSIRNIDIVIIPILGGIFLIFLASIIIIFEDKSINIEDYLWYSLINISIFTVYPQSNSRYRYFDKYHFISRIINISGSNIIDWL